MKKILGLDLGTNSIGWALVNEAENDSERSSIIQMGVRVNPLTVDEQKNFTEGKTITTTADRTLKRSMRRNLQRRKLRRERLKKALLAFGFITLDSPLWEHGPRTTFETMRARARAVKEEVSLLELARILLLINRKRGYKSNRKAMEAGEGLPINGMEVAKKLMEENLTPGQYALKLLEKGEKRLPDFYRSDLIDELDRIWQRQAEAYPEVFTRELRKQLEGKGSLHCSKIFFAKHQIDTPAPKGKDVRREEMRWRSRALDEALELEWAAYVVCRLCGAISDASGYLATIGDHSKALEQKKLTIGQYLICQLEADPHFSTKNVVFYRQDYIDEFDRIWKCQQAFHPEALTPEARKEIRNRCIFFQRPLKSKKGMLDLCTFERREVKVEDKGDGTERTKTVGLRVCPKSSPLFQEVKVWQQLNNLVLTNKVSGLQRELSLQEKQTIHAKALLVEQLKKTDMLKLIVKKPKDFDLNYEKLDGNRTQAALYRAYMEILEASGHEKPDLAKSKPEQVVEMVDQVFQALGARTEFLTFDPSLSGHALEQQPHYRLWHLLYSCEGDNSITGLDSLVRRVSEITGLEPELASLLATVSFADDYGNLSSKALRRILPHLQAGLTYDKACEEAGYRHSARSLTREELDRKPLAERLENLPKNSLRNPVVEKILNQMVNVVNAICQAHGRPDEIRIELARELKKTAKEREDMTKAINRSAKENEAYRDVLRKEFGIQHPSRNDVLRYRLYLELKDNDFHTLYTNTYIPREKLFSKEFDVEHIIPQALLFDDSFANKTLEARQANLDKGSRTALDYVEQTQGEEGLDHYRKRVEDLYGRGVITRSKRDKLLMRLDEIPKDFIQRDLRDTQYIARRAKEMLEGMVRRVVATTGSVTDRLREDWQLVNVMQELNWDKYEAKGLVETYPDKDGRPVRRIKDWTKRNDHRHHAMDALTIAFTREAYIQYLNNLNARRSEGVTPEDAEKTAIVRAIEQRYVKDRRFLPPMPLGEFRVEAKRHLEQLLVSIKAKNKVVTRNVNRSKRKGGKLDKKVQLTPRGQLHNETIYGSIQRPVTRTISVGARLTHELAEKVTCPEWRVALLKRLGQNGNDPKKAFTGRNSLDKAPIYYGPEGCKRVPQQVKIQEFETLYPVRKPIDQNLNVDKVIDDAVRKILEKRLEEFGGDPKKAFVNLEENPIWLNEEKGIRLRHVRVRGLENAIPLHTKRDHTGQRLLSSDGKPQEVDFVNTGNNHHVAIFRDAEGKLQEHVVSFLEATERAVQGLPAVDRNYRSEDDWQFLFTMKQNEYFVFPGEDFDPTEIDLMNPDNYSLISPHLFRVQTLSKGDYYFRHHLETNVEKPKPLRDITWKRIQTPSGLEGIIKVRINHIGQIVSIGEYL